MSTRAHCYPSPRPLSADTRELYATIGRAIGAAFVTGETYCVICLTKSGELYPVAVRHLDEPGFAVNGQEYRVVSPGYAASIDRDGFVSVVNTEVRG